MFIPDQTALQLKNKTALLTRIESYTLRSIRRYNIGILWVSTEWFLLSNTCNAGFIVAVTCLIRYPHWPLYLSRSIIQDRHKHNTVIRHIVSRVPF